MIGSIGLDGDSPKDNHHKSTNSRSSPAVMLEETPLPRMFIPGKIVHIYTHRGGYKAAYVPRAFRELRRISLAANMLQDHMSKSYYEALLECKTIRYAKEQLPEWTTFEDESTCSCCASRFTWASTSDSEAQEARDKHNCRSCGSLVCAPCSKNRFPLPSMGIASPVRVCDRCYHDMGCVINRTGNDIDLTRSFIDETNECKENKLDSSCEGIMSNKSHQFQDGDKHNSSINGDNSDIGAAESMTNTVLIKKQKCSRQRRSHVVDELASRFNQFV
uniref:FYVE-type domain-containing protein n=1 Tax=Eucampia antarctica TaxID=49252 RepID=A0A7S2S6U5_9STRA